MFIVNFFNCGPNPIHRVEIGHLTSTIDISLKDSWESCYVIFHKNVAFVGSYKEHLLLWQTHDLELCFLETGLNMKTPSIPIESPSDAPGYNYIFSGKT